MKNWIHFVGEGRSGHTVMSGILGCHPHVRLSDEHKPVSKFCRGWSREELIKMIMQSGVGQERARMGFINLRVYNEPLLAIGDKCGWDAVNEVRLRNQSPDILDRFSAHVQMPVKVIYATRYPLDNIAAWVQSRKYQRIHGVNRRDLTPEFYAKMVKRYFKFYRTAAKIIEGQDVFHLKNEELIANPKQVIARISNWLDLPADPSWLRFCASKVRPVPNERHKRLVWPADVKDMVFEEMSKDKRLQEYL